MSQSTSKIKAGQLWSKNKEDLLKQLAELKTELGQLRIQKVVSSGTKLNKMYGAPNYPIPFSFVPPSPQLDYGFVQYSLPRRSIKYLEGMSC